MNIRRRAAATREESIVVGCLNVEHNAIDCRHAGIPIAKWCDPCALSLAPTSAAPPRVNAVEPAVAAEARARLLHPVGEPESLLCPICSAPMVGRDAFHAMALLLEHLRLNRGNQAHDDYARELREEFRRIREAD